MKFPYEGTKWQIHWDTSEPELFTTIEVMACEFVLMDPSSVPVSDIFNKPSLQLQLNLIFIFHGHLMSFIMSPLICLCQWYIYYTQPSTAIKLITDLLWTPMSLIMSPLMCLCQWYDQYIQPSTSIKFNIYLSWTAHEPNHEPPHVSLSVIWSIYPAFNFN